MRLLCLSAVHWRRLALLLVLAVILPIRTAASRAYGQPRGTILLAGWNNVLYTGPSGPVATVLAPLAGKVTGAIIWDATGQRWHSYFPSAPQSSDLQTILSGQVYWFSMQSPANLPAGGASPAPAQLLPGWNNVVYFGSGAPGSAVLEQSTVWAWDQGGQRWTHRDPASTASSDLPTLTALAAYWVFVPGGQSATAPGAPPVSSPAEPPAPAPRGDGCYPFTSLQPNPSDIDDALVHAASSTLATDTQLAALPERSGADGSTTVQPPYVPPTLLRSIGWVESAWHQATWATQRGQSGPTLSSSGCAYGLMQIASGMTVGSTPTHLQQEIGTDFRANAAAAVQLLTRNWNRDASAIPYLGRHDPHILEDWYFATWAFHCFGPPCAGYGAHDNPDDPSLPWPRPMYNSADQISSSTNLDFSDYPYQELVYGLVMNPPVLDGHTLWRAIALQLPAHGAVGFPDPKAIPEPSAHLDDGSSAQPATAAATGAGPPANAAGSDATSSAQATTPGP